MDQTEKNGYLNKFTKSNAQIKPKPKSAPDLVDCTKCETPMAAPANNSPGPRFLSLAIIYFFTIISASNFFALSNFTLILFIGSLSFLEISL